MASQWRSSSKRRLRDFGVLSEEGAELPSLDETENAIKCQFKNGCAYCGGKFTESGRHKAEMDHAVPISRGGGAGTDNLRLCHHGENQAKGPLSEVEFRSLLQLLDTWDPGAAQSLLVRLKGGYWVYRPTSDQRAAERRAVVKKALLNTPAIALRSPETTPWPV